MPHRSIAIIPARGGSKGIPNKNLHPFAGKPLLAWSILQAKAAKSVDAVFVSSDDARILEVAKQFGAIPITRPAEFSTDTASSESALLHALDVVAKGQGHDPELVIFLQATSPLREAHDIDEAVRAFRDGGADSLFSDAVMDDVCLWEEDSGVLKGKTFDPLKRGRRQDRRPLYLENGSIYVFKPALLRSTGNRLGGKIARHSMAHWKSFEIDTLENLDLCEYFFRRHLLARNRPAPSGIKAFRPELIAYDFDGVMTDNRVMVLQAGGEGVVVNRADGWGVRQLREAGFKQIIVSTEASPVVSMRAAKLGLEVMQDCRDKLSDLQRYCASRNIRLDRVLYIGNDVNDLDAMRAVGFPVAPADSHPAVLAIAKHVTRAVGGAGVIKELSEALLTSVHAEVLAK